MIRPMSDLTPNLGLAYVAASQAQKHVTVNESLRGLDALTQLSVASRELVSPPDNPANGGRWIVAAPAQGAFAGQTGAVAAFQDGAWRFYAPRLGWRAFVEDEARLLVFDGSDWTEIGGAPAEVQNATRLGVGTTADAANPVALKINNLLATGLEAGAGGNGDLRLVLNKESAGDVLSILLQSGFSARAELGLIGNDDLTLKVSSNGAAFQEAARFARGDGRLWLQKPAIARSEQAFRRRYVEASPWLVSASAADNAWNGIAWSQELGLFAAVANTGTGNRVMTSADGINWTARATPGDNSWRAIAWSPELGLFAAVANSGTGNRVMTSVDGVSWKLQSTPADNDWSAIAWSSELGLFATVATSGSGNRVMTSPDGINWTLRSSAADMIWSAIAWSPELGLFAALAQGGTGNRVMTSPDGINWTARATPVDNNWQAVAWSPELGLFAAVANSGTGNRVMTSADGINWTARATPADESWSSIAWAPELGLYAAVANGGTGNRVMTSPDGVNWTPHETPVDNAWRAIAWAPELGLFVAVANNGAGNRAMTSVSMFSYPFRGLFDLRIAIRNTHFAANHGEVDAIATTSGAISVTLPAAPQLGATWEAIDAGGVWASNNVNVDGNGERIAGSTAAFVLDVNYATARFVFVGGALGWVVSI